MILGCFSAGFALEPSKAKKLSKIWNFQVFMQFPLDDVSAYGTYLNPSRVELVEEVFQNLLTQDTVISRGFGDILNNFTSFMWGKSSKLQGISFNKSRRKNFKSWKFAKCQAPLFWGVWQPYKCYRLQPLRLLEVFAEDQSSRESIFWKILAFYFKKSCKNAKKALFSGFFEIKC